MATKYTYSISQDTLNGIVDVLRLTNEIQTSVIVTALDYINTSDDTLDIWFKTVLSSGDETILDGIVAAHTGAKWDTGTNKTIDNKLWAQQTSRPLNTTTYFTSRGDDISNPRNVGGGDRIVIIHEVGDPAEQYLYLDFNIKENRTFIHEGYLMWQGANFDSVNMSIIPTLSTYEAGTNTNYNLYGGYLIVPAAGNGTVQVTDMKLVEVPVSRDTGLRKSNGFWNADYNMQTHEFENVTAAPLGDGVYNMFAVEVTLGKFANDLLLLNNGFIMLQTADTEEVGHGMRFKFGMNTYNSDHAWKAACIITMHRERTT